jgi:hypothetical protein
MDPLGGEVSGNVAWLVGSLMVVSGAAVGVLLSRVERVRIQPPAEPDPTHDRRRSDRAPA